MAKRKGGRKLHGFVGKWKNWKKRRNDENDEGSRRKRKKVRVRVVYIYVTWHKYSCVLLN